MISAAGKAERDRSKIGGRLASTDPALGRVIDAVIARIGPQRIAPSRATPFEALVRAIVYEIKHHTRDPKTRLAPPELKEIHPLGKSPVMDGVGPGGRRIRRNHRLPSGHYGGGRLQPSPSTAA